jgi:hypothetical protein
VRLISPERSARMFVERIPTVVLTWSAPPGLSLALQIARLATFETVLIMTPVEGGAQRYVFEPPGEGVYWWRLVDGSGAPLSEARKLTLIIDVPPIPLFPQAADAVYVPPGQGLTFIWSSVPAVSSYLLEVAATPAFAPLLFSRQTSSTQTRVPATWPEGVYHWRVRAAEMPYHTPPHSRVSSFTLYHAPPPATPELIDEEIRIDAP